MGDVVISKGTFTAFRSSSNYCRSRKEKKNQQIKLTLKISQFEYFLNKSTNSERQYHQNILFYKMQYAAGHL